MKRLFISIGILAVIIALGCSAISYIDAKNSKLYGKIEMVIKAYDSGDGVAESIESLNEYFDHYEKMLGCIVSDEMLMDMAESVARLMPMYLAECDEFTAECRNIITCAEAIRKYETPNWYRIL